MPKGLGRAAAAQGLNPLGERQRPTPPRPTMAERPRVQGPPFHPICKGGRTAPTKEGLHTPPILSGECRRDGAEGSPPTGSPAFGVNFGEGRRCWAEWAPPGGAPHTLQSWVYIRGLVANQFHFENITSTCHDSLVWLRFWVLQGGVPPPSPSF